MRHKTIFVCCCKKNLWGTSFIWQFSYNVATASILVRFCYCCCLNLCVSVCCVRVSVCVWLYCSVVRKDVNTFRENKFTDMELELHAWHNVTVNNSMDVLSLIVRTVLFTFCHKHTNTRAYTHTESYNGKM